MKRFFGWLCAVVACLLLAGLVWVAAEMDYEGRHGERRIPSKTAYSITRVRNIGYALQQYADEHAGALPPLHTTAQAKAALRPYLGGPFADGDALWDCSRGGGGRGGEEYLVNPAASGRRIWDLPDGTVLVYEPRAFDGEGRVALFADRERGLTGRWLPERQWQRQMDGSGSGDW